VNRAEHEYRAAVAIEPDLVEAWVNLGGTLLLKWDFEGAALALHEAVTRRPGLVEAHFNLGQAQLYRGDAGALVSCCRRVLELQPQHAAGHYFLAVGLLAIGDVVGARRSASHATTLGHRPMPEFLRRLEQAELAPSHPAPVLEAVERFPSKEN
jgi:Flp pilus assembly protein TadD